MSKVDYDAKMDKVYEQFNEAIKERNADVDAL